MLRNNSSCTKHVTGQPVEPGQHDPTSLAVFDELFGSEPSGALGQLGCSEMVSVCQDTTR